MEEGPIINRVANSGLITLNLEEYYPTQKIAHFDLKDHLFKELILKEKDFRTTMKEWDWSQYKDQHLLVYCSTDAIIPVWAFMLVAANAGPYAQSIFQGNLAAFLNHYYMQVLAEGEYEQYDGKRIVIKGCSNKPVPPAAYAELTRRLKPFAQSVMYGEPCSTVPIFKRPRVIKR